MRNIASLICEASAPVGLRWVFVVDGEKRSDRMGHDFLLVYWLVVLGFWCLADLLSVRSRKLRLLFVQLILLLCVPTFFVSVDD